MNQCSLCSSLLAVAFMFSVPGRMVVVLSSISLGYLNIARRTQVVLPRMMPLSFSSSVIQYKDPSGDDPQVVNFGNRAYRKGLVGGPNQPPLPPKPLWADPNLPGVMRVEANAEHRTEPSDTPTTGPQFSLSKPVRSVEDVRMWSEAHAELRSVSLRWLRQE